MKEMVKKFISKILAHYPELYIDFEYDPALDEYYIWHNSPELEFKNKDFTKFVGEVAQEVFFDNNIYNFSFGYDYHKAKELENKTREYTVKNTKIDKIKINFFNVESKLNYSDDTANKTNASFLQEIIDIDIDISFGSTKQTSYKPYLLDITSSCTTYDNIFSRDDIKEVA